MTPVSGEPNSVSARDCIEGEHGEISDTNSLTRPLNAVARSER